MLCLLFHRLVDCKDRFEWIKFYLTVLIAVRGQKGKQIMFTYMISFKRGEQRRREKRCPEWYCELWQWMKWFWWAMGKIVDFELFDFEVNWIHLVNWISQVKQMSWRKAQYISYFQLTSSFSYSFFFFVDSLSDLLISQSFNLIIWNNNNF